MWSSQRGVASQIVKSETREGISTRKRFSPVRLTFGLVSPPESQSRLQNSKGQSCCILRLFFTRSCKLAILTFLSLCRPTRVVLVNVERRREETKKEGSSCSGCWTDAVFGETVVGAARLFMHPPLSSFMGFRSHASLPNIFLILLLLFSVNAESQEPSSHTRLTDLLLRDYAFRCYRFHAKTGHLYAVPFPANISGIAATTARYRSGSLRRYGAHIKEFFLSPGTVINPYVERLIAVRQRLEYASSNSLGNNIPGFRLVSPLLGLLFYNGDDLNATNPVSLDISSTRRPIVVDFSNVTKLLLPDVTPYCAFWGLDGKVRLSQLGEPANVCLGYKQGHYGLIVEEMDRGEKASKWKIVLGSSVGGGLGVVLLGLLLIALVKKKKRLKMEEMERRAYEEEALQVSMVGHVRAPVAGVTRTMPILEDHYSP